MRKLIGLVALGALLKHLFDPQRGAERRRSLAERLPSLGAVKERVPGLGESSQEPNDPTLKAKVETELFRDDDVPKGQINVLARDGVVELRGEVRPELIEELVRRVRSVEGVHDVENLLHAPGTEAPTHR